MGVHKWNWFQVGHVQRRIEVLNVKLKECESKFLSEINMHVVARTERKINSLLKWEEIMRRQRSRQVWLSHDDKSSRFFHSKANGRSKRNHMHGLMDDV